MDWYYKRAKIISILTATELFMLTDKSPHFNETYAFLDRALDDFERAESWMDNVQQTLFGLWTAKNSFIEMFKNPVADHKTMELKSKLRDTEPRPDRMAGSSQVKATPPLNPNAAEPLHIPPKKY